MHDATKQLNALAGDHKESPLGEHEIALRGSRSADQSGRIKCEERPVACIIQVSEWVSLAASVGAGTIGASIGTAAGWSTTTIRISPTVGRSSIEIGRA